MVGGDRDPNLLIQNPIVVERFRQKLGRGGDCLEWQGSIGQDGYGKFQITIRLCTEDGPKQVHVRAHRFALALKLGKWPDGLALHSCDNPRCCNPDHLREGTQKENIADVLLRGRRKRHRHNSHQQRHEAA